MEQQPSETPIQKKPRGRPKKYQDPKEIIERRREYSRKYYREHPRKNGIITIRPLSSQNPDLAENKRIKNHIHHLNFIKKHGKNDQKTSKYNDMDIKIYTYSPQPNVIIQTYVQHDEASLAELLPTLKSEWTPET